MNKTLILDQLREISKNLSHEKIARELNVSARSVYRWLKGINSPSNLTLNKINRFISKQKLHV